MAKQPDPNVLRCLAIQQPFAWAVCAGIKKVENRTISTPYRGRVAILASTSKTNVNEMVRDSEPGTLRPEFFSYGAIIGVAMLVDVVELNRTLEHDPDAAGPLCWIFENAAFLPQPIPSKGKLNLYSLTEAESEAVRTQLSALRPQPPSEEARAWEAAYRAPDADPTNTLVRRGNKYFELEQYDDAIRNYNDALQHDPNDANLIACRGNAFAELERFDEALKSYNDAIRLEPENVDLLTCRADFFVETDRPDDAIADYDAAHRLEPDNMAIILARAIPYLWVKRDSHKVILDCGKVINSGSEGSIDPEALAMAYLLRREAYRQIEDGKNAEADYKRAAALDPQAVEEWEDEDWE